MLGGMMRAPCGCEYVYSSGGARNGGAAGEAETETEAETSTAESCGLGEGEAVP